MGGTHYVSSLLCASASVIALTGPPWRPIFPLALRRPSMRRPSRSLLLDRHLCRRPDRLRLGRRTTTISDGGFANGLTTSDAAHSPAFRNDHDHWGRRTTAAELWRSQLAARRYGGLQVCDGLGGDWRTFRLALATSAPLPLALAAAAGSSRNLLASRSGSGTTVGAFPAAAFLRRRQPVSAAAADPAIPFIPYSFSDFNRFRG